jgi:hypothetical protein
MSLIYAAEPDALKARDRAFSLAEARLAAADDPDKKLKWMLTAVDDAYAPYLVKIHALTETQATISFVDCKTGDVLPEQVAIDLTDRELVWDRLPSTLDGWSRDGADCAFLFLSSKIHDLTPSALESGGGTGKWPKAASVMTSFEEVRGLLEDLLDDPAIRDRLTEDKRRLLAKLLGGE